MVGGADGFVIDYEESNVEINGETVGHSLSI